MGLVPVRQLRVLLITPPESQCVKLECTRAGLQRRPIAWGGAVGFQAAQDGRPVVAPSDQVLVDADRERPGVFPIEAGGK